MRDNILDFIKTEEDKRYMVNLITYAISPTISGYKPSTIITISNKYKSMYDLWSKYGEKYLREINLSVYEIKSESDLKILMFYNSKLLSRTVFDTNNMKFLQRFGYSNSMSLNECLGLLKLRYLKCICPHEIGIFLGIPVKDVVDFINYNGNGCICCGYWKVYHDRKVALETFEKYDSSKSATLKLLEKETDLKIIVKKLCLQAVSI
ncbi:DUF3793 family protein [Clostridium fermenticellae]|uniref:DUF3793 family protein n=1 Tax=Clostridium fermenticellae TaxID=2068654 RepID=A0A386H5C8_9CLOT|nr:DUF3793 family protein [Clostridium fermenticellae]AYD40866.1 DUF3793 family protein [Clostridium fermenticellae]